MPKTNEKPNRPEAKELGNYLANIRTAKRMTLREVEDATNKDVSNAYLSQLENGRINKPSPSILHSLASVYNVPYEMLMEKAGYISSAADRIESQKHGRVATFAGENLTPEEEDELLEYLAFLRTRRGHK
ncbi:helix-turn-helix domain-containing protein [Geotalea toluenoxydans]|uniref:helix-turn-helix domain-containing protein n=1 Tax=Geotalea toluenoxydans TaxID=421624 RepID=UPI000B253791|nr:helix-turn-helix transcriptional regulator [Geotalea toluenoxydans]